MGTVLIIDDEEKLRNLLARIIRSEGLEVTEASDCRSGLKKLESFEPDIILCDVKLPDGRGIDLTKKIKLLHPFVEVILLTAYGNIPDGVEAMKNGAFDYLVKGDDNDKIIPLLHKALEKNLLNKRVHELEQKVSPKFTFDSIIGKSKSIVQAIDLAKKVAPNDTTVLLVGETGTGKEIFSQAIHQASGRSKKSFVALNCSNFSKEMLESELFGYKSGAFTSAVKDKKGLLEEANEGTLFLDEIGELPLELQAKLLRVLETKEFMKLGDTKVIKSNFRLIAATNRDLKKESEAHRFRSDLYYRLNIFQIELPPLRDRAKDIGAIANYFTEYFSQKMAKRDIVLEKSFVEALENYTWPGNIRELRNVIERCLILAENPKLSTTLLPFELQNHQELSTVSSSLSNYAMATVEKRHIQKILQYTQGNKAEAARLLEIGIATLYRKIEEYGLH